MAFFSRPKEPMSASDLSHITRGLHQAAAATHNLIAQQYIALFDQFFDYNIEELGTPMKAKMVEIALNEGHTICVPLIALVAPKGLALHKMDVDLSVKMHSTEVQKATHDLENGDLHSEKFFVTFGTTKREGHDRDPDEVQIRIEFKACEPPEAINRIIEEYTNLISPIAQAPTQAPAAAQPAPQAPSDFAP
ncbi:DUF2589 domain-containing protein [Pseudomonas syringae]|uniref:DUF2589 domain-containing protein n=1 Tax=Pseudomonas syringae TaxID=317 RepID=A0A9Q3X631_PSESX|nr:DUF2589 domain-containing protein [Pseudomonas syringae]MCF5065490.1 DUF2589 domain-containing protein [Pseudomonas syringae]MCF5074943.1 DUF2589 domain-containing protein [Pseudomonas syringae]MCF5121024.1 DUF2589 domain-containing protein [Pseudomonas syringae]MCF5381481.1 DUF2589 domain-containing protein [Pseudomonas syringae]